MLPLQQLKVKVKIHADGMLNEEDERVFYAVYDSIKIQPALANRGCVFKISRHDEFIAR